MLVGDTHYRTIWFDQTLGSVQIVDQTKLPYQFDIVSLNTVQEAATAISSMQVRGAPLIGATGAYGLALAMREDCCDAMLHEASEMLIATRPTAINLRWAIESLQSELMESSPEQRKAHAWQFASRLCDEDVKACEAIGEHGAALLARVADAKNGIVNVMTHCNAGWLATVDWGTALAPVYKAHDAGISVHVWVSETRPRNQGLYLSAWELAAHGVPHTVITDNAAGHLMQTGQVDCCIVGTDRTLVSGDVCNKIGTYLKALSAKANGVPFYVAAPSSSIDWHGAKSAGDIPIEQRGVEEVINVSGLTNAGELSTVQLRGNESSKETTAYSNYAFDVTPAELVTSLITERGVVDANLTALNKMFAEHFAPDSVGQDG
ncbi:MAG: S-methyl-5-thioribose-1-phosphate isomerase [Pseudomonadota bacterium]